MLVREQVAAHRELLARYEWLWERFGERPELARRVLTLKAGFAIERALISFWQDLADEENARGSTLSSSGWRIRHSLRGHRKSGADGVTSATVPNPWRARRVDLR